MLTRLLRLLGVDLAEYDVVVVPLEQWHRVFERVARFRRRCGKTGVLLED